MSIIGRSKVGWEAETRSRLLIDIHFPPSFLLAAAALHIGSASSSRLSQMRRVLSYDPETMRVPEGFQATEAT